MSEVEGCWWRVFADKGRHGRGVKKGPRQWSCFSSQLLREWLLIQIAPIPCFLLWVKMHRTLSQRLLAGSTSSSSITVLDSQVALFPSSSAMPVFSRSLMLHFSSSRENYSLWIVINRNKWEMGNNCLGNFSVCSLLPLAIIYQVRNKIEHILYFQAKGFTLKSSKNKNLCGIDV